jgi:uncharacterized protein (DUF305 family)
MLQERCFGSLSFFLVVIAGCAGNPAPTTGQASPTASDSALAALYAARADSALTRFTQADVQFVAGMIHHHAQALEMASMAASHEATSTIRTLTARILNGQGDEIRTMQRWLTDRGQEAPMVGASAAGAVDHSAHLPGAVSPGGTSVGPAPGAAVAAGGHPDMPGMLSVEQMARLDAARGPEFDRLFLSLMIQHHRGAIVMVEQLFATDGALQDDSLFKLASEVLAEQKSEIERMTRMWEEITGSPLGPTLFGVP